MLMRMCKCGRRIPQGKTCSCRHKVYDKSERDKNKKKFYHSREWRKLVEIVKARANGLDEYELSKGKIIKGNTVHHIFTVDERPDLKMSIENLIYVSSKTHNEIHREYEKGVAERRTLQNCLKEITERREADG